MGRVSRLTNLTTGGPVQNSEENDGPNTVPSRSSIRAIRDGVVSESNESHNGRACLQDSATELGPRRSPFNSGRTCSSVAPSTESPR